MTVIKCNKKNCKFNSMGICTKGVVDIDNCKEVETNENNNDNKDLLLG